jgi:hypothetical protein
MNAGPEWNVTAHVTARSVAKPLQSLKCADVTP